MVSLPGVAHPIRNEQLVVARHWSPAHRVGPDSPPMMVLHGTEDCVVPYEQAGELVEALTAHGVPNELVTLPGEGHGSPASWTRRPPCRGFWTSCPSTPTRWLRPRRRTGRHPAVPTAGEWRP
ncbi:hypothetical protein BJF82_10315 [Kytococcus sp. CUA-901]|nr:hypothetical protein BJF82_10315 [Kytococcus sp. CUA-901]